MPRKPVLAGAVDLEEAEARPGEARPQPAFHDRPAPAPKPGAAAPVKERAIATTVYFLPGDHDRLRKLAIDRGTTLQGVVMDGLDLVLTKEGQPPLERWRPRRKPR